MLRCHPPRRRQRGTCPDGAQSCMRAIGWHDPVISPSSGAVSFYASSDPVHRITVNAAQTRILKNRWEWTCNQLGTVPTMSRLPIGKERSPWTRDILCTEMEAIRLPKRHIIGIRNINDAYRLDVRASISYCVASTRPWERRFHAKSMIDSAWHKEGTPLSKTVVSWNY